ncbi:homoprotocatechuate degradation operon regulator HpaR [Alysiella filiformis]|uniref:Homoprotocatechuate degradation operon regulator, HpaR n=1 Tax=Alysiella filiformis DSM 16848 TaxID=1120981 RepID=A0A286E9W3_9NEIS|nr:homoprotocatechuate degradation operon regulator HpaR [Alysiella filiformis]QMT31369.1 homoprotocatechuate degradation operon regulator HpaR [Alysiella filiformis]UBQ55623.1 homoprotocatechuate degradation operon regulator HpaR [Alysiella filiformis DSM 16848]SOD67679.1 homoprotocatechuate degradation operon regulator, HpaR [Alysiella filiformis DSM 16848]
MSDNEQHLSLNVALVQARDAVMAYLRPALNEAGITEQQWRIIRALSDNTTLDFQDLSEQTSILRPSLTGILNRLERAGYVMRLKPASDQRRVFVKLTSEGAKLYSKTLQRVNEGFTALENEFTTAKLEELKSLLNELTEIASRKHH